MEIQHDTRIRSRSRLSIGRVATAASPIPGEAAVGWMKDCSHCVNRLNGSCAGEFSESGSGCIGADAQDSIGMDSIARRSVEGFSPAAPRFGGGRDN